MNSEQWFLKAFALLNIYENINISTYLVVDFYIIADDWLIMIFSRFSEDLLI